MRASMGAAPVGADARWGARDRSDVIVFGSPWRPNRYQVRTRQGGTRWRSAQPKPGYGRDLIFSVPSPFGVDGTRPRGRSYLSLLAPLTDEFCCFLGLFLLKARLQRKDRRWPTISRSMTTFIISCRVRRAVPPRGSAASIPSSLACRSRRTGARVIAS